MTDKINKYAEDKKLKIITIATAHEIGIYVLFEKEGDEWCLNLSSDCMKNI